MSKLECDADRAWFIRKNAVALVKEAVRRIVRLRAEVRRLENANRELRKHCNVLQERLRARPSP